MPYSAHLKKTRTIFLFSRDGWVGWCKIEIKDHLIPAETEIMIELGNTHDWCKNKHYEWGVKIWKEENDFYHPSASCTLT